MMMMMMMMMMTRRRWSIVVACSAVVFFRRANVFAREKRHVETSKRGGNGASQRPCRYGYSHQSSLSRNQRKMMATTIRTQTSSFRPPKIRLPELNFVSSIYSVCNHTRD